MSIDNLAELQAAIERGQVLDFSKVSSNGSTSRYQSYWRLGSLPGVGVTPPASPGQTLDRNSPGAFSIVPAAPGNDLYVAGLVLQASSLSIGTLVIADRLVEVGGLNLNLLGPQAVNSVPIPARAGTGEGCGIWIDVVVRAGTTSTTAVVTYTNQDGVPGRVSEQSLALSAQQWPHAMCPVPLQPGDTGVRSVESVELSAATGAGTFAVVILKRITEILTINSVVEKQDTDFMKTGLAKFDSDAALQFLANATTTSTAAINGRLITAEG